MKKAPGRGMKISPWLTLFIGYVLGYILYPVLQMWTCRCDTHGHEEFLVETLDSADQVGPTTASFSLEDFVPRYLHPPQSWLRPQRLGSPKTLSGEYQVQTKLFVAVITAEKYLPSRALAVYDTWGCSVSQIMFFVGADCNTSHPAIRDLPIVKLPGIPDNVYPPQKKVFAVLHYIHDHYLDGFQWFMRADDDVYVRGDLLENLLGKFNFNELVYLGLAGKGKTEDIDRLGLRSHERYCMGGPGVIFSRATLRKLAPYLQPCLSAVDHYNEEHPEHPWYNEDVELGRCVSRSINVQCSTSAEGRSYFIQDYTSAALHPHTLWQNPIFRDLITLHPIKNPENLYAVHHFYEVIRAGKVQAELQNIEKGINTMCDKIPSALAPPWQAMPVCSVQLCSGVWTQVGMATDSTPFTIATKLPKVYNPQSLYEPTPWEHFSTTKKHEIKGFSAEHELYTTFRSEIAGIVSLVEHHVNKMDNTATVLRPVEVVQGYTRFNEEVGREYIVDVMFIDTENRTNVQTKRTRLIRPLSQELVMVTEETTSPSTIVNVVVPIFKADQSFYRFVEWYYKTISLQPNANIHLILCVIGDTQTLYNVQAAVANHTKGHSGSRATVLSGRKDLSPTGALELGVSVLSENDLVFMADTSLRIQPFFFRSCRQNTAQGSKVYFPVPYIVFGEPKNYPGPGRWAYYSYSSHCIYKSDFLKFSDSPKNLFQRVSRSKLEIFQAPEPGLIKVGVPESCDSPEDAEKGLFCEDLLNSSHFESDMIDYLYEHDRASRKSLSFLGFEDV